MRRLLLGAFLMVACGDSINLISATTIKVISPTANGTVFSQDPLDFHVTATNQAGVGSVELYAGSVLLKTCSADSGFTIDCDVTSHLADIAAQIQGGKLHLSITASDRRNKNVRKKAALDVFVKPIRVSFTAPAPEGDPAVAIVKGTSTLSFAVQSEVAIDHIDLKREDNLPLASINGGDPYELQMNWPLKLGLGDHSVIATATDAQSRTDTATLAVRVLCLSDGECPDPHQTCAVATGVCQ